MTKSNAKSTAKKTAVKTSANPTKVIRSAASKKASKAIIEKAKNEQAAEIAAQFTDAKMAAPNDKPEADTPKVVAEIGPKPEKAKRPKLAAKIRRKGDILAALKKDGLLYLDKGLYRLDVEGIVHPVSKRRASALVKTDLVKPVAPGMSKGFVHAWQYNPASENSAAEKGEVKA